MPVVRKGPVTCSCEMTAGAGSAGIGYPIRAVSFTPPHPNEEPTGGVRMRALRADASGATGRGNSHVHNEGVGTVVNVSGTRSDPVGGGTRLPVGGHRRVTPASGSGRESWPGFADTLRLPDMAWSGCHRAIIPLRQDRGVGEAKRCRIGGHIHPHRARHVGRTLHSIGAGSVGGVAGVPVGVLLSMAGDGDLCQ